MYDHILVYSFLQYFVIAIVEHLSKLIHCVIGEYLQFWYLCTCNLCTEMAECKRFWTNIITLKNNIYYSFFYSHAD